MLPFIQPHRGSMSFVRNVRAEGVCFEDTAVAVDRPLLVGGDVSLIVVWWT